MDVETIVLLVSAAVCIAVALYGLACRPNSPDPPAAEDWVQSAGPSTHRVVESVGTPVGEPLPPWPAWPVEREKTGRVPQARRYERRVGRER